MNFSAIRPNEPVKVEWKNGNLVLDHCTRQKIDDEVFSNIYKLFKQADTECFDLRKECKQRAQTEVKLVNEIELLKNKTNQLENKKNQLEEQISLMKQEKHQQSEVYKNHATAWELKSVIRQLIKNKVVEKTKKTMLEKDKNISDLENIISDLENIIFNSNAKIEEKEAEKEAIVTDLNSKILDNDTEINSLKEMIALQEKKETIMEETHTTKTNLILELKQRNYALSKIINEQNNDVNKLNETINEMNKTNRELSQDIVKINNAYDVLLSKYPGKYTNENESEEKRDERKPTIYNRGNERLCDDCAKDIKYRSSHTVLGEPITRCYECWKKLN